MIRIGNNIYWFSEACEWIVCGIVKNGPDGEFIQWYS